MDSTPPETERLLMAANLHRLRGELNEAEAMIHAALQNHPNDFFAREFLGDILAQKGDYKGAETAYRAVLQDSPGRAAVEEKLARLILRATPIQTVTATGATLRSDRNPMTVLFLSMLWPGGGHFYLGDKVKGLLFSAAMLLLSFASLPALAGSMGPLMGAYSQALSPNGLATGGNLPTPSASSGVQLAILTLLTTALYIWAAIDSYALAKRAQR